MKKVLAKNLKVGDVIYDTEFKLNKFSISKICGNDMWLSAIDFKPNVYLKNENGMYLFSFGESIWYMED